LPSQVADEQDVSVLVARCVKGDAAAWSDVVRLQTRRVYNLCYRFTGSPDDAEDLTQEVFIKVYRSLNSYDASKSAFPTWLTTLTRNLLVDHFRRTKQDRATDSLDAPASPDDDAPSRGALIEDAASVSPEERVATSQKQQMVHNALQKLSPDLREAVILRDLQDMDYKDIARVLKVPEGTVKSRINRGRAELARLLQRTYKQVM
jgi:RNA polymerase sigma factor (sigma-70 family)